MTTAMHPSSTYHSPSQAPPVRRMQLVLTLCVFIACMVGIFSRPIGFLAVFWPANAIFLGLLLRRPTVARRWETWVMAFAAYMAADLLTGSSLLMALALNLANITGVAAGWLVFRQFSVETLRFQRQRSVLLLLVGCLVAASACTAVGSWPSAVFFDISWLHATALWLSSEFFNYILITPVILSAPLRRPAFQPLGDVQDWKYWGPLLALILSEMLSTVLGGPGAIAFSMPAMVWCAMAYGVFPITVLSLMLCLWKTATIAMGALDFLPSEVQDVMSYRTGLALLSLAPLAVASAYSLRTAALHKLHHAANHDFLTGLLSRQALMENGNKLLSRLHESHHGVAVLMADIDHFKTINDRFGHAQGDVVLQEFAQLASASLRPADLLGRLGGEEFAIILPHTDHEQALRIATRLCERLQAHRFVLSGGEPLQVSLSVGLYATADLSAEDTLERLLGNADMALYMAKNSGRNQVRQYGPAMQAATH